MVDTHNFARTKRDSRGSEFGRQIALADVVILNKMDMVDQMTRDQVADDIRSMNSACIVQFTDHSRVDLDGILGIQAYTSVPPPR